LSEVKGLSFTQLGNWLVANDVQFRSYYVYSKSNIPKSARLANIIIGATTYSTNRRNTIQEYINNLVEMELLYQKSTTKAKKNFVDIPIYDLTIEGRFLAWIIKAKDPIESNFTPFPDKRPLDIHTNETIYLIIDDSIVLTSWANRSSSDTNFICCIYFFSPKLLIKVEGDFIESTNCDRRRPPVILSLYYVMREQKKFH
jgi:hypothetical protein